MNTLDLTLLRFTRSFVFLKRKQKRLRKRMLRSKLFQISLNASVDTTARVVCRYKLEMGGQAGSISFLLGRTTRTPTFANGSLDEEVFAYILLLESEEYAAVQLRNVGTAELEPLLEYYDFASYKEVTSVLTDSAQVLKLAARIINPAQSGLTGRAFEGNSLQNEMPQYGSGKTIPRSLKANDNGETISITANAARITSYGQATTLTNVGKWFDRVCNQLKRSQSSKFVARFAEPVDFLSVVGTLQPHLLAIDTLALQRRIDEDSLIWRRKFKRPKQTKLSRVPIPQGMVDQVIACIGQNTQIYNGSFGFGSLIVGGAKIKLDLHAFKSFTLFDGQRDIPLSTYINSKDLFSIYYDRPEFVYMAGSIFKDGGLLSDVDAVIASLDPWRALTTADREKIDKERKNPEPNKGQLTHFPATSVFSIVEGKYANADYIFCDDLGDEWADHIVACGQTNTLSFVHSKHGTLSGGASGLHEVVGQALKNLGNLLCQPAALGRKIPGFAQNYTVTQISRTRRAPPGITAPQIQANVERLVSNNELRREAVIFCSFMSAKKVTNDLYHLRINPDASRGHVRQLLWLLSYFVAACRELNVVPRIVCQP